MQKLLVLFFTFSMSTWGIAQTSDSKMPEATGSNWARLSDTTYTLRFPANWTPDQSGLFGSRFFLFAPLDTATDKFRENFNLIVNDMTKYPYATLEFLADGAKSQIESMITDIKMLEYRIVHKGDDQYYIVEYSGKQGTFDLHWKQHYWLESNRFYVLTFTAEESQYLNYLPLAERVLSSFTLK